MYAVHQPKAEIPGLPFELLYMVMDHMPPIIAIVNQTDLYLHYQHQPTVLLMEHTHVKCLSFNDTGTLLCAGTFDDKMYIFDVRQGKHIHTMPYFAKSIFSCAFSKNSLWLAAGYINGVICVWSIRTLSVVRKLRHETFIVWCVRFHPILQNTLYSGSTDGSIRVWTLHNKEAIVLQQHHDYVTDIQFVLSGETFASCSLDGTICVWDASNNTIRHKFNYERSRLLSISFNRLGTRLACTTNNGQIYIVDTCKFKSLKTVTGTFNLTYYEFIAYLHQSCNTLTAIAHDNVYQYLFECPDDAPKAKLVSRINIKRHIRRM